MKYRIKREVSELSEHFTKIPNKLFNLPPTEFKLYCWLLKHEDGFQFGKTFMWRGTVMRNVTVEKTLLKLEKRGLIKTVKNDIILCQY